MIARSPFRRQGWHVEIMGVVLLGLLSLGGFYIVVRPISHAAMARDSTESELEDQRMLASHIVDVRIQLLQ